MNNDQLIDKFKTKFDIKTDTELAFIFELTPSQINDWRSGHRPMPDSIKWRMLDHLGYAAVRDLLLFFTTEAAHKRLMEKDNERMLLRAEKRQLKAAKKK